MSNPRTPADQLFYGPLYGDPLAQQIPHLAGQNPDTLARMRYHHGRYLAGFGQEPPQAPRVLMMTAWMLPAALAGAWVGKTRGSVMMGFGAGVAAALATALIGDAVTR